MVDAATSDPVPGALVYATWSYTQGFGLNQPSGVVEFVTTTDANGRYEIPRQKKTPPGENSRLSEFRLVVYKRGFVAYRSDRRFGDFGPRLDFAQRGNRVRLEKWRPDFSHANHVRYVGGGSALTALAAWETEDASRELAGVALVGERLTSDPFLRDTDIDVSSAAVAARLVNADDIIAVTSFDGTFETGPLGDEPDTDQYSSYHLRANDKPESFDVAIRMWKVDEDAANQRFEALLATLPNAREEKRLGDVSLVAQEGDIRGVAFLDRRRGAVVLITCGTSQCRDDDQAFALGARAFERLQAIWPIADAPVGDDDESESDQEGSP